jgi:hypothetical protein
MKARLPRIHDLVKGRAGTELVVEDLGDAVLLVASGGIDRRVDRLLPIRDVMGVVWSKVAVFRALSVIAKPVEEARNYDRIFHG